MLHHLRVPWIMWGEHGRKWGPEPWEVCLEACSQGFGGTCLETFIGQPAGARVCGWGRGRSQGQPVHGEEEYSELGAPVVASQVF